MRYLFCFALLISQTTFACINIEGVTLEGTYKRVGGGFHVDYLRARMAADPSSKLMALNGGPKER